MKESFLALTTFEILWKDGGGGVYNFKLGQMKSSLRYYQN